MTPPGKSNTPPLMMSHSGKLGTLPITLNASTTLQGQPGNPAPLLTASMTPPGKPGTLTGEGGAWSRGRGRGRGQRDASRTCAHSSPGGGRNVYINLTNQI